MRVGSGTEIRAQCVFTEPDISIGSGCLINFKVVLDATAPVTIGDNVDIAYGVTIVTATHDIGEGARRASTLRPQPVVIESGCWIGARATVLPGVRIGHGCVVAAGAVVTTSCPPNGLYAGVPARRIRELSSEAVMTPAAVA